MKRTYQVLWDNGHACDAFSQTFTSKREAERFAVAWKREMVALEPEQAKEARAAYTWEIIEAKTK